MLSEILGVAVIERLTDNYRGVKDMEIDALATNQVDHQEYTNEDWVAWTDFVRQEMEALDYLGKGKGNKDSKGKSKGFCKLNCKGQRYCSFGKITNLTSNH